MKAIIRVLLAVLMTSGLAAGCGDDGDGGTGTLAIDIADAKPALPEDVRSVYVTFSEVSVHRSGGGWVSLPLPATPYPPIDLLQFCDGVSTQFVPPVELKAGRYTQLRMLITAASMVAPGQDPIPLEVPSDFVRTDKNFEVAGGAAVDLTVHFDLSQSIVDKGNGTYSLKPVLHLQETQAAARIQGSIDQASFGLSGTATVVVYSQETEYTRIVVTKAETLEPTPFAIYWLVPNQVYQVEVVSDGFQAYQEEVAAEAVEPGETFTLNAGAAIVLVPIL
ncbi:MAG: DUF4382 domain-containing protein [bacterium]